MFSFKKWHAQKVAKNVKYIFVMYVTNVFDFSFFPFVNNSESL